ncbi:hypothetical protein [Phocoenobacter skyensis]|uniref:Intracellular growth attenuator protein IgaA n=1 Tax=Phocoenobacter skyensis TaxID=97481 RepID=A0ABT9JLV8_9PAST|nr:hypothetical protein [Pasteurella skyensis]MDP8079068.1 hypothetical protein [Pasteurella skyensis]MDP8085018.1 hypothetical protein [Pasteurella skyensis]
MQDFIFIGALLLALYSLYIAIKYLVKDIKSKRKLKHPENAIRSLSLQEKKHLSPHLKILNLSLISDEVYQLDNAIITIDGFRHRGTEVAKMRANGIDISIPEPLELFLQDNTNTIEYVVAKFGVTLVAVALCVNGEDLLSYSIKRWEPQSDEQILAIRDETVTEYKVRQSQEVYVWGALAFLATLIALLCASNAEDLVWFNYIMLFSGVMLILMLFAIFKRKLKVSGLKSVQKIKGTLQIVRARALNNINAVKEVAFLGLNHPFMIKDKKLSEVAQDITDDVVVTADLITREKGHFYDLIAFSDDVSIDTLYKNKTPRPHKRLIIFTLIAMTGSIGFFNSDVTFSENLGYARAYLLNNKITKPLVSSLLNSDTKTYHSVDELLAQPPKFGDQLELLNIDNLDVVLKERNGSYNIVEHAIHLHPNKKYIQPVIPEIITEYLNTYRKNKEEQKLNAINFLYQAKRAFSLAFYYERNPITYQNESDNKRVKEEILTYFEKIYGETDSINNRIENKEIRDFFSKDKNIYLIQNPQKFIELLDQACIDNLPVSCKKLYKELANIFSNPPNNYLAGLYEKYQGKEIPVTEFKNVFLKPALYQNNVLFIMPRTIDQFEKTIRDWARRNKNILELDGQFDLTKTRGGIILTDSKQRFASNFRSFDGKFNFFSNMAYTQNTPQNFIGTVTNIAKDKDTLVINFIADKKYPLLQYQAIAIVLGGILSILVFLITLIGYLLPSFYPRSKAKQTSGHLVE